MNMFESSVNIKVEESEEVCGLLPENQQDSDSMECESSTTNRPTKEELFDEPDVEFLTVKCEPWEEESNVESAEDDPVLDESSKENNSNDYECSKTSTNDSKDFRPIWFKDGKSTNHDLINKELNNKSGLKGLPSPGKATRKKNITTVDVDGVKRFQCDECEKSYVCKHNLIEHKLKHAGIRLFKCPVCGKDFISKYNLKSHLNTHLSEKPFQCTECDKRFTCKANLEKHKFTHSDIKPYNCTECKKSFSWKCSLDAHLKTHLGIKFQCDECDKRYSYPSELAVHKRSKHAGINFKCPDCDLEFSTKSNLRVHQHKHTGVKPYVCEHCGKGYSSKYHLADHALIHSDNKPFKCMDCEMQFVKKTHLRDHRKLQHKNDKTIDSVKKTYSCTECDRMFLSNSAFIEHKRRHLGIPPKRVVCKDCGKDFANTGNLNRHRIVHEMIDPDTV